jgi:hypothetical protein
VDSDVLDHARHVGGVKNAKLSFPEKLISWKLFDIFDPTNVSGMVKTSESTRI